ncbi:MAG: VWA domain-containing protein [Pyrinomonadaceae bacterium]
MLLAPIPLYSQSGRARPKPADGREGNAQRPRRSAPSPPSSSRPASDQPGQPITPDSPGLLPSPVFVPSLGSTAEDATTPNGEIDPDEVIRVNSNLVPVTATVLDQTGKAVTDLGPKDFELLIDGQLKPIGELTRAETPVLMAVLFDNSYSQRASRELERQAAVRFFRNVLRPVDRAAIFSIWTDPIFAQPLTGDVQTLVRAIENFGEPDGATALLDTVSEAANYLRLQRGRKVIIIISDGTDTSSYLGFAETLRRVQAADCQVYAIQTGVNDSANLHDLQAERRLQDLAEQTGGSVYVPKAVGDLAPAFTQIAADLAHQYVISYYPTEERRDNLFRVISVRVPTRPNMRVRARKGYYPRRQKA